MAVTLVFSMHNGEKILSKPFSDFVTARELAVQALTNVALRKCLSAFIGVRTHVMQALANASEFILL